MGLIKVRDARGRSAEEGAEMPSRYMPAELTAIRRHRPGGIALADDRRLQRFFGTRCRSSDRERGSDVELDDIARRPDAGLRNPRHSWRARGASEDIGTGFACGAASSRGVPGGETAISSTSMNSGSSPLSRYAPPLLAPIGLVTG